MAPDQTSVELRAGSDKELALQLASTEDVIADYQTPKRQEGNKPGCTCEMPYCCMWSASSFSPPTATAAADGAAAAALPSPHDSKH
jgi:hypothetical protein